MIKAPKYTCKTCGQVFYRRSVGASFPVWDNCKTIGKNSVNCDWEYVGKV